MFRKKDSFMKGTEDILISQVVILDWWNCRVYYGPRTRRLAWNSYGQNLWETAAKLDFGVCEENMLI